MAWKPIVAGLDASPESAAAVRLAWRAATAADTQCHVVHTIPDVHLAPLARVVPTDTNRLIGDVIAAAKAKLRSSHEGQIPHEVFDLTEVTFGSPAWALAMAVKRYDAELLVLGGKHHESGSHWFGGSTPHHAVRTVDVPVYVTWSPRPVVRRVLAAVDLSFATKRVLDAARRYATLFGAELHVVHVIEQIPFQRDLPITIDVEAYNRNAEVEFRRSVRELLDDPSVELHVCQGPPAVALRDDACKLNADLVVIGSHGRNWKDRVLVGDTTERLLNRLPTSLLVVPVEAPVAGALAPPKYHAAALDANAPGATALR